MAETSSRGKLASITNRKRYGEDFYIKIGAKGGRATVPKGFALMEEKKQKEASRKGGIISRRPKKAQR